MMSAASPQRTLAVVLERPEHLVISDVELDRPAAGDVVVDIQWSGISTGTERLLWSGTMPSFPGLGYPLIPGYESVGRVSEVGAASSRAIGEWVFVPGARCFGALRGLFGGAAQRLVVPESRVTTIDEGLGEQGVLLALAATAHHALAGKTNSLPDLIVGHGVLGRLLARLTCVLGDAPTVWERNPNRCGGGAGYQVLDPRDDPRRDYRAIYDVSGDGSALNDLIARLAPGGELVLAGFYGASLTFDFPAAFMREARLRIAAEWREADIKAVKELIEARTLNLDGLITHRRPARCAPAAYPTAFFDPGCLKMVLDWRAHS